MAVCMITYVCIICVTLLNDIMDLNLHSLCTLVPAGSSCVFYATRHEISQFSDLITHTETNMHRTQEGVVELFLRRFIIGGT